MADTTLLQDYNANLDSVISTMIKNNSLRDKQRKELNKLFDDFGFTNDQIAQVIAQTVIAETQYLNQYGNMAAIELLKEARARELQIKQIEKIDKEIELLVKQIIQAQNQADLIAKQQTLIERQEKGYDDNLLSKAAEYEASLASFAVNADSDSAQAAIDKFVSTIAELKDRIPSS